MRSESVTLKSIRNFVILTNRRYIMAAHGRSQSKLYQYDHKKESQSFQICLIERTIRHLSAYHVHETWRQASLSIYSADHLYRVVACAPLSEEIHQN